MILLAATITVLAALPPVVVDRAFSVLPTVPRSAWTDTTLADLPRPAGMPEPPPPPQLYLVAAEAPRLTPLVSFDWATRTVMPLQSAGSPPSRERVTLTTEIWSPDRIRQSLKVARWHSGYTVPSADVLLPSPDQRTGWPTTVGSGVAKAGKAVGSGVAKVAKPVGSGVAKVAKPVGSGVAKVAKPVGSGVAKAGKAVGSGIAKVGASTVKAFSGLGALLTRPFRRGIEPDERFTTTS
ncbi:MAG: hypothetical protein VX471_09520 [Acidobacteriota bacterium]|nr:hypothetical protein [Acidobacteriota bacterium]